MDDIKAILMAYLLVTNNSKQELLYHFIEKNEVNLPLVNSYLQQAKADAVFVLMSLNTKIATTEGAQSELRDFLIHLKTQINFLDTEQLDYLIG